MVGGGEVASADRPALFLLPRTFFSKKDAAVVPGDSKEQEMEAIGDFFMSMILSSSAESTEDAKNISKSTGDPSKLHFEGGDRAGVANAQDQVQGRRPALGRKRAHFSFNPNVSDSHVNVDLKSSVDHIEDPDELFLAFENLECAKKELKKQMGEVALDSSPNMQWTATRKRRPGILGRKASYKYHFPEHIGTAEALVLFQGENMTFSPSKTRNDANSNTFSQQVSQSGVLSGVETNGSDLFDTSDREGLIADKEKGVDKLLDTLLHCFEDLDKGEEIDFLQERLQIKSTNVDKICLPPLDGIQVNDGTIMDRKLAAEKFDGSLTIRVSPTVASSPLAAISVLRRRISQIDPLKDPFSMPYSNEKPTPEKSFPDEGSKEGTLSSPIYVEHPDMAGSEVKNASGPDHPAKARSKLSHKGKLQSTITEAGMAIPTGVALGDSEDFHCRTVGIADHCAGHASAFDVMNAVGSTSCDTSSENNVDDMILGVTANVADCGDEELPLGTPNCGNVGASAELFDSRGPDDSTLDNDINTASFDIDGIVEDKVNNVQETPASGGQDQSSIDAATDIAMDGRSGNSSILPEQNDKENQMDLTASINNGPVELEAPRKRQNKQWTSARRHSLAGAGMAWQSGVRRSTRIKMKPLEYWRGERLLYARIHDSLPTLVGVKYASPAEAGRKKNQVLKVKSYVSEEYAGLVQKIALH